MANWKDNDDFANINPGEGGHYSTNGAFGSDTWDHRSPGISEHYGFGGIVSGRNDAATTKDQSCKIAVSSTTAPWKVFVRGPAVVAIDQPGYYVDYHTSGEIYWYSNGSFGGNPAVTVPTGAGTVELRCVADVCTLYVNGSLIFTRDFSVALTITTDDAHQGFGMGSDNATVITAAEGGDYPPSVGGGTTPVSANRSTTWATRAAVTAASRSTTWAVRERISATRPTSWFVRATITAATRSTTWAVGKTITATRPTTWAAVAGVSATRSTTWNVAGSLVQVSANRPTTWAVRTTASATRPTSWFVRATIAPATSSTTWKVHGIATSSRSTTWATLQPMAGAARPTTWATLQLTGASRFTRWIVVSSSAPQHHDYLTLYPETLMYLGERRIVRLYQGAEQVWPSLHGE